MAKVGRPVSGILLALPLLLPTAVPVRKAVQPGPASETKAAPAPGEGAGLAQVQPRAQDSGVRPGAEVVLKSGGAGLQVDGRPVAGSGGYRRYKVERAEGPWLWLSSGDVSGWARAEDVLPAEDAASHFSEVIRAEPKAAWAYNRRAMAWYDRHEYDRALADYAEAIRLDPGRASFHNNRAAAWLAKKDYDKAIADYSEAIRLDPDNATAYYGRGVVRHETGDDDGAIADYSEAIRIRPRFAGPHNNRGLVRYDRKEYDRAIADFNEAIRLDPDSASTYNNRGNAWEAKRDDDRALADYSEAIRLDPRYVKAYLNRALVHEAKRDYIHALADYDEAIRLDPNSARAHRGRAWIWATCPDPRLRDGKTAVAAATRANELTGGRDPVSLGALAAAEAEAGNFPAAIRWQSRAIDLLPDSSPEKAAFRSRLELYRAGKPYQSPAP